MAHNLGSHFGCMEPRNVTWAHAVNSCESLAAALAVEGCHMIEADLLVRPSKAQSSAASRWKRAGASAGVSMVTARDVIMCHPPCTDSDLTFDMFFKRVFLAVKGGRRVGLKLDFKDENAVLPVLRVLEDAQVGCHPLTYEGAHEATRRMPVWLNADVVKGPGGRIPIPGEAFIKRCQKHCPSATLSLGWTHTGTPFLGYTALQIESMSNLVRGVRNHVTFAVSAAHLFASSRTVQHEMLDLLNLADVDKIIHASANAETDKKIETPPRSPMKRSPRKPAKPVVTENGWPVDPAMLDVFLKPDVPPLGGNYIRTVTLWGPATRGVLKWAVRNIPANVTYLDVKESNITETAVINAHAFLRPMYW